MKKLIFTLVICLLFPSLSVYANSFDISLIADKNMVTKGEKVLIQLSLSEVPSYGLSSGNYYINFDESYYNFSCDNIIYEQNVISSEIDCNVINGKIILIYVDSDGGDTPIGKGLFLNLPFDVINDDLSNHNTSFVLTGEGFGGVSTNGIENLEFSSTITCNVTIEQKMSDSEINNDVSNVVGDKVEGTVDSPKTGIFSSIILFLILFILGYLVYMYNFKKNKFPKV